jgi:hypothetical protein
LPLQTRRALLGIKKRERGQEKTSSPRKKMQIGRACQSAIKHGKNGVVGRVPASFMHDIDIPQRSSHVGPKEQSTLVALPSLPSLIHTYSLWMVESGPKRVSTSYLASLTKTIRLRLMKIRFVDTRMKPWRSQCLCTSICPCRCVFLHSLAFSLSEKQVRTKASLSG